MAPGEPQRAQDDLQDGARYRKMPQIGSQDASRGPKHIPRRLKDASETSKKASKKPTSVYNLRTINDVCFSAWSLPMAIRGLKMAPRWPKRALGEAQESPKTATRALQEGSRRRSP
eukprot:9476588-Pyramimonas_sp.AAC.1